MSFKVVTTFKKGDHVVYPGHGVGKIVGIEEKKVMDTTLVFYMISILDTGMKIMVPQDKADSVGLRHLISKSDANKVMDILRQKNVIVDQQTWNRRYREYMEKVKTGSIYEIAEVLRDLMLLKVDKELSFGERKMLSMVRNLLMDELTLVTSKEELKQQKEIKSMLGL